MVALAMRSRWLLALFLPPLSAVAHPAAACSPRDYVAYFASGSAQPTAESTDEFLTVIDEVASVAGQAERLRIVAHSDGAGPAGGNLQLSKRRAGHVRALLLARGVDPAIVEMDPRGETTPAVAAGEMSEQLNRRVNFLLTWKSPSSGALAASCGLIPPPAD